MSKTTIILLCALFFTITQSVSQEITVSGNVTDTTGEPVPFGNVLVKSATKGTATDESGHYEISVKPNITLIFSASGGTPPRSF